jgi:hypothetical protein
VRYAALVLLPVLLIPVPYAIADLPALRRELFGYGGVADFGWIALSRGARWLATGVLPRSEAAFWAPQVAGAKVLFLAAWAALAIAHARGRFGGDAARACLAVLLAFLVFYGALSAQYLLWVVPFGALLGGRAFAAWSAAATVGLLGFYVFLAPGVLWPAPASAGHGPLAGLVWLFGVVALLGTGAAWLLQVTGERAP